MSESDLGNDEPYEYPFGLVAFTLCNDDSQPANDMSPCDGASCTQGNLRITFLDASTLDPHIYLYRKYGPVIPGSGNRTFYTLPNVSFTANKAGFLLRDGQLGDDTGVNGVIVDAGGPAVPKSQAAPALSLAALAFSVLALGGVAGAGLRRRRR